MADESPRADLPNQPPTRVEIGQATSVGQVRTGNEDSVLCEPLGSPTVSQRGLLCAVADGMGGHAMGEVASDLAVRTTREAYYGTVATTVDEALRRAIETANDQVFSAGAATSGRDHMGSTLTAAVVLEDRAVVGHVGDSRCYLLEGNQIRQITRDHSWVAQEVEAGVLTPEEARVHPRRNIITRALGLRPEVEVDIYEATLSEGSSLILCSDGLHGPVRDEEIRDAVLQFSPQRAVEQLISLANERGGLDNISAIVVKVGFADERITPIDQATDDRPTPTTVRVVHGQPPTTADQPSASTDLGAADEQFEQQDAAPWESSETPTTPLITRPGGRRGRVSSAIAIALLIAVGIGAGVGVLLFLRSL